MSKLKFRAYDLKEKCWVSGFALHQSGMFSDMCKDNEQYWYDEEQMKNIVIQQYTGLKDKNGKEIYESDKVEFNDFDSLRTGGHTEDNILQGEVCFSCGAWIVKTDKGHYDLYTAIVNDEELEVIGNIYENPELLEESK